MNILQKVMVEQFETCLDIIGEFLPNLLTSLLILAAGVVIAAVLKIFFAKFFKFVGLDGLAARFGLQELMKKGGIAGTASALLSKFIGGIVFLIFAILSMNALKIPAIERLLEKLLFYLPNIFVALLILVAGFLLGNFLGRAALIASVNAGMRFSGLIGGYVKFIVFLLAGTMALEHVGIGKDAVVMSFAIVFGGVVLAFAIAFGLGGRDIAKEFLEKKLKGEKEQEEDGINHL